LIRIAIGGTAGGNVAERFVAVAGRDAATRVHQSHSRAERIRQEGRDVARTVGAGEVLINAESSQQVGIDARAATAGEFLRRVEPVIEELRGGTADGLTRAAAERIINEACRDAAADGGQMIASVPSVGIGLLAS
jgi:hypothetical protein